MWSFRRRFGRSRLAVDPACYDQGAARLQQSLTSRDWRAARDFLRTVSDPDDRAFYLDCCAGVEGVQDWIEDWIRAEPESTLPLLVRGCHGVYWAWEARGAARAARTSRVAFQVFFHRLKMAEDCLDEVIARDPGDTTAGAFLVASARGRQVDRTEATRRFTAVVSVSEHHILAHEHMLQYLCQKWSGSHQEMFAFARSASAQAPDGSLVHELIPIAHLEQWIGLQSSERSEYWSREGVREELRAAAERSIWHPAAQRRPGWPSRFAPFAMAMSLAQDHASAAAVFEALGDRVTSWPWSYLRAGPVDAFEGMRARAQRG